MLCIGKTYVFKDLDRYESNELIYNRYYKDGLTIEGISKGGIGLIKDAAVISESEEQYFIEKMKPNLL